MMDPKENDIKNDFHTPRPLKGVFKAIFYKKLKINLKHQDFYTFFDVWRPLFQRKPTIFCIPGLFDMLFQNLRSNIHLSHQKHMFFLHFSFFNFNSTQIFCNYFTRFYGVFLIIFTVFYRGSAAEAVAFK